MHRQRICAAIGAVLLLASCASASDVPSRWPVATGNEDCHAIAGSYAPVGESESGYAPYLSGYIFPASADPQIAARAYQADHIEIAPDAAGAFQAHAMRGTQELATRTLRCENGVAHVSAAADNARATGDSVAGVDRIETSLMSAVDGSLLVKRSEGAGGLYNAVVPADLNETNWYRFPRVTPP